MNQPANLVYFGSSYFSARILTSLLGGWPVRVVGVVTTPDKPTGRKQVLTPSAVAVTAMKYSLPVFKPEKLDDANLSHLKLLKPDLFLVISYGQVIPSPWLTAPKIGTFNLHFSLLPKYRGALCISEAIRNEDQETGVTLMVMNEGLDAGPIISQAKIAIDIDDNNETLTNKLTQAAIKLLSEYLPRLAIGNFTATPQNKDKVSITPTTKTRTRENAFLGWSIVNKAINGENAPAVHALIRSNNPNPGAWTKIGNLEVKLVQTRLDQKENRLEIELVQLPGKQPISWKNFLSGHPNIA